MTASAAACRTALLGDDDAEPDAAIDGDTAVSSVGSGVYAIEHRDRTFHVVKRESSIYVEGTPNILSHVCLACLDAINDIVLAESAGDAVTDEVPSAARLESDAAADSHPYTFIFPYA